MESPNAMSLILMSFGNYNPGWRCLDNVTANSALVSRNDSLWNDNYKDIHTSPDYSALSTEWKHNECEDFETCENVEFNPDANTVVSEWRLLCNRKWIPSIIISIQMSGMLVGAVTSGMLADTLGRKRIFIGIIYFSVVLNVIGYFCTSWQMFAVIRFFVGSTYPCITMIPYVIATEFAPNKLRSFITTLPSYGIGLTSFAVCAMILRDWRRIQLATAIIVGILALPAFMAPESIRWLKVKGKKEEFISLIKMIARINKKPLAQNILNDMERDFETFESIKNNSSPGSSIGKYSWLDLWRGPSFRHTLIISFIFVIMPLIYYSMTFGIKSLTGYIYTNLMISGVLEIPIFLFASNAPNLLGRKRAFVCFSILNSMCLGSVAVLNGMNLQGISTTVLFFFIKTVTSGQWYIMQIYTLELYPTVIRVTAQGYASMCARVGSIIAPYLIPNRSGEVFIVYTIMAGLMLLCALVVLFLPETNGKNFKDTFQMATQPTLINENVDGGEEEFVVMLSGKGGEKMVRDGSGENGKREIDRTDL